MVALGASLGRPSRYAPSRRASPPEEPVHPVDNRDLGAACGDSEGALECLVKLREPIAESPSTDDIKVGDDTRGPPDTVVAEPLR